MTSYSQSLVDNSMDRPIAEKCSDVLNQELPELLYTEGLTTISSSLHSIRFVGDLTHWKNFQNEVMSFLWNNDSKPPNPIMSLRIHPPRPYDLHNERVYCGDELSVSGRFTQNVLNPVTSAARLIDNNIRFGDFKICQEAHKTLSAVTTSDSKKVGSAKGKQGLKIPDFVAVHKGESKSRFLGEAKTPWNHKLEQYINQYRNNDKIDLERAFGQVADYMYAFSMKYAFLTTYEETIFFKQELHKDGKWRLYFSDPISHGEGVPVAKSHPDPRLSLRRCMLWLCVVTSGGRENYIAHNNTPIKYWVRDGTNNHSSSQLFSPCRESLNTENMHPTPLAEKNASFPSAMRLRKDHLDLNDPLNTPSHVRGQSHSIFFPQGKSQGSQSSQDSQNSQRRHHIDQSQQGLPFQQRLLGADAPRLSRSLGQSHDPSRREISRDSRASQEQRGQRDPSSLAPRHGYPHTQGSQKSQASSRESRDPREPPSFGHHYDLPSRQKPQDPPAQQEQSPVQLEAKRLGGLKGKFNDKMETFKERDIKCDRDGRHYVRVNGLEYFVILPPGFPTGK